MDNLKQLEKLNESLTMPNEQKVRLIHPGIDDKRFADIELEVVDAKIALQLRTFFDEFGEMETREAALTKIIDVVRAGIGTFVSFEQITWLLKFFCNLLLLKDVGTSNMIEENKLMLRISQIPIDDYNYCPLRMHIIAKTLFDEVLEDELNLLHVVKKLSSLNKLLYYISIALVFAGLFRKTGRDIKMFRFHDSDILIEIMDEIRLDNMSVKIDLNNFFTILKLLSCYQNLVILRHVPTSLEEEHKCYADYFKCDARFVEYFVKWLNKAKNIIDVLRARSTENEGFLHIHELIELDMVSLMKQRKNEVDA